MPEYRNEPDPEAAECSFTLTQMTHVIHEVGRREKLGLLERLIDEKREVELRMKSLEMRIREVKEEIASFGDSQVESDQLQKVLDSCLGSAINKIDGDGDKRSTKETKKSELRRCIAELKMLEPKRSDVAFEDVAKWFERYVVGKTISNRTVYFKGVIPDSLYVPDTGKRNRRIFLKEDF